MVTGRKKAGKKSPRSSGVTRASEPKLRRNGRLTAFGKAKSLQIGMDGVRDLKPRGQVVKQLMEELNMTFETAVTEYDRAVVEFQMRYEPYSAEQCNNAVGETLREVLLDKTAPASARVTAAKEFRKIYSDREFGTDDESKCRFLEGLWLRKIKACSRIGPQAAMEVNEYVQSEDFDLYAISEREVEALEEKAGING